MATHGASISSGPSVQPYTTGFPPVKGQFNGSRLGIAASFESASAGAALTFRMRGFDQNGSVNSIVYWSSTEVDSDASDYIGSAGPVVNIVIQKVIGQ